MLNSGYNDLSKSKCWKLFWATLSSTQVRRLNWQSHFCCTELHSTRQKCDVWTRPKCVFLQIIFCSCGLVTIPLRENNARSLPRAVRENVREWFNQEIKYGNRVIKKLLHSGIAKYRVSQITYLPQPSANTRFCSHLTNHEILLNLAQ